jgi:hypothetical protein
VCYWLFIYIFLVKCFFNLLLIFYLGYLFYFSVANVLTYWPTCSLSTIYFFLSYCSSATFDEPQFILLKISQATVT